MRNLFFYIFLTCIIYNKVQALPKCTGEYDVKWTNCYGKQITISTDTLKKNAIYIGEFKNGKHDGKGILTFFNGEQYSGDFINGNYHGDGIYIWPEEKIYWGEFNNNKFNGFGSLMYPPGMYYSGYFKDNYFDGKGAIHSYTKNISWVGELKEGKRINEISIPKGSFKYIVTLCKDAVPINCYFKKKINNVYYYGRYNNRHFNGLGSSISIYDKYLGQHKNDIREGFGTLHWVGESKESSGFYVGEFKKNMFNGFGIIQFGDGFIYTGTFVTDKMNGDGICFLKGSTGKAIVCEMVDNIWTK